MKDLGEATYILGIKIYRDRSKSLVGLSQSIYTDKMLKGFSMKQSKRGNIPMTHGMTLLKFMCLKTQDKRTHEYDSICFGYRINHLCYVMY